MAAVNKPVYFNVDTEKELLEFATNMQREFSGWVKAKIREELALMAAAELAIEKPAEDVGRSLDQAERKKPLVWNIGRKLNE